MRGASAAFQFSGGRMISKTRDAELINRIANSEGVREHIDYRDDKSLPMDFTPACERAGITGIVWLTNGSDALGCFELMAEREYQAHLFFASSCRGARAVAVGREMMAWLARWADRLWGVIPLANRKARWFARAMGFRHSGFGRQSNGVSSEYFEWAAA